ncbi:hypothetical protein P6F26_16805 [Roseibacterium sp. SDUM158017]|uniref:DnaT-like ssDNA-binding protein n=1 Tax=Roseicyclus salinarum TaxID=3036773 RepID=UPI0024156420|nr:DnaT-like ssDNA-binding protein [Roseibacterium sp. SDUM158017]MDG4650110.1 hypothetical protein [Roseibacterium sp. SDUM158017]
MALDITIGGTAADSYATLLEYTSRAAAMGWTLEGTDAANEVNLRRAAVAIDASYSFRGTKNTVAQAREWPRFDGSGYGMVYDFDPYPLRSDEIPQRVKDAQMEMAYLIQGGADPLATYTGGIKRQKVDVIEVEYAGAQGRPRYDAVDRILGPYLTAGPGQGRMVRA